MIINLTASGFYNEGLAYPCWPYGFLPEYGQINIYDSNNNFVPVIIMTTPQPPEYQNYLYIQATANYKRFEVPLPLNKLTGTITAIEVVSWANRADYIVCPDGLSPNPYANAYFVLDIDYIDLR